MKIIVLFLCMVATLSFADEHHHHDHDEEHKGCNVDKIVMQGYYPELVSNKVPMNQIIKELVEQVDRNELDVTFKYLASKGIRSAGTAVCAEVALWIGTQLENYGYKVLTQSVKNYGNNVYIEKVGTKFPEKKIIIGAHYDSVRQGPGINDNGSGVAILLEIARLLQQIDVEHSIILIWFAGEELGLHGGYAFADKMEKESKDVKLMFNMDQVGGLGKRGGFPYEMTTITCERDEGNKVSSNDKASYAYTDTLATMITTYSTLKTAIAHIYASDYMPFEAKGYVVTGLYEYVPQGNPHYHQPSDTYENMSLEYVYQICRGALAFGLHVAIPHEITPVIDVEKTFTKGEMNIVNGVLQFSSLGQRAVTFKIFDTSGKLMETLVVGNVVEGYHSVKLKTTVGAQRVLFVQPYVGKKAYKPIKFVMQ